MERFLILKLAKKKSLVREFKLIASGEKKHLLNSACDLVDRRALLVTQ